MPAGSLGVLFDQEYGIVAYAPVLLLGFVGLAGMLRDSIASTARDRVEPRRHCCLIALPAIVDPWWSKSMMPGRPVFLLLPLLAVPIAWLYARLEPNSAARAGAQALLLVSLAVTLTLVVFDPRVPALQEGDGSSALLQWMSPTWQLWREAPTYVAGVSRAVFDSRCCCGWSLSASPRWMLRATIDVVGWTRRACRDAERALCCSSQWSPRVPRVVPDAAKRIRCRGARLFPLLETFDPIARPIAIRYDGFSRVQPGRIAAAVRAVCSARTADQIGSRVRVVLERPVPAAGRPLCARSQRIRRSRIDAGRVDVAAAWP